MKKERNTLIYKNTRIRMSLDLSKATLRLKYYGKSLKFKRNIVFNLELYIPRQTHYSSIYVE